MKRKFNPWYYMLHPRIVAVIASSFNSRTSAMPASWITPVSVTPPLLAVAVSKKRFTYGLIISSHEFSVNIVPKRYIKQIHFLGTVSGRDYKDKIKVSGLTSGKAKKISSPIILESIAIAECKLLKKIETGDHDTLIGEVVDYYSRLEYKSYLKDVLLHLGKNEYTTPSNIISVTY